MSAEFDKTRPPQCAAPFMGPAEGERMGHARPGASPCGQAPWGPRPRTISDGASTERAVASEGSEGSSGEQARISFGLVCLLLFVLVLIARIPELFPWLAELRLGTVTAGIALLSWLVSPKTIGDKIPVHIKQVQYLLVLFGLSVATIPVAVWPGGSFEFVVGHYWKQILFFLLVLFWCRSVRDIRWFMWVYCLGMILLVGNGLLSNVVASGRFNAESKSVGANELALYLAMVLPFLAYLFSHSGAVGKLVTVPMFLLCIVGIIFSESRGGFLSLITAGSLIFNRSRMQWSGKVAIIAIAVLSFALFANQSYWDRIEGLWSPKTDYDGTGGGRTEVWTRGLKVLVTSPWGVGIDGFAQSEAGHSVTSQVTGNKWLTAHNSFLQVGVELGIAGLIAFVLLLGRTLWELRQIRLGVCERKSTPGFQGVNGNDLNEPNFSSELVRREVTVLAGAVEISLWTFVVGGSFLSQAYSAFVYGILALGVAAFALARRGGAG